MFSPYAVTARAGTRALWTHQKGRASSVSFDDLSQGKTGHHFLTRVGKSV